MKAYDQTTVDALAEQIWWKAFQKHHAEELHLYDEENMPTFSRMAKRRREHYRKKANEMLEVIQNAGFKLSRK
ncbi:MAG: hypothetical protein RDU20_12360 [Desulfomonilaceae bacterium]|jgi:hypothetical protein|nr:hypothetical protein [Desulfomonilaceae bacterium]